METSREATRAARPRCRTITDADTFVGRLPRRLALAGVIALALPSCAAEREVADAGGDDDVSTIVYRQFSSGPSLGRGQGSADPESGDYGALKIFTELVEARTAALGPGRKVVFSLATGPASFADVAGGEVQAAHLSGGSLNSVWGFLYNSVPFGPGFSQMIDFLHEGDGVELANRIYRERDVDVVAFPVVGSPAQGSGYFQKPIGTPDCPEGDEACASYPDGIGLDGLCSESWTLRYLPPSETIVDLACDGFDAPQRVEFVRAIPGGSAFLTAVQQGVVDGFEFATPADDYDAEWGGFFAHAEAPDGSDGRNAGEVGLRFLHYPAWHQPFFLGWMVIDRSQVWDRLDPGQQAAIEAAAREAVVASFEASSSVECGYLRSILDVNDGRKQRAADGEALDASADVVLTRWNAEDLDRLRQAALPVLEGGGGRASPTGAEADYATVSSALLGHLGYASMAEMLDAWTAPASPLPGGCSLPS